MKVAFLNIFVAFFIGVNAAPGFFDSLRNGELY
jgi:uncharacterized transporter YbjL